MLLGKWTIRLRHEGLVYSGHAANTDIVVASAEAYVNALNRLYAFLHSGVEKVSSAEESVCGGYGWWLTSLEFGL